MYLNQSDIVQMPKNCFMCNHQRHLIESCPKLELFIKEKVNEHRAFQPPQVLTLSTETINEIRTIISEEIRPIKFGNLKSQSPNEIMKLQTQIDQIQQQLSGVIAYLSVIAEHAQRITGVKK